jgi:L-ribulose-5-phosphate 4-epimerase
MKDLKELKKSVLDANLELPKRNLVIYSWGNVSGLDREKGMIVIKPAGIPYRELTLDNLSVTDLKGNVIEGPFKPSVDLAIHIVLYKAFPDISGITHTHSTYATMWAQGGKAIPCYGTTHADYFYGDIPCTRMISKEEATDNYEEATGKIIVEAFSGIDPLQVPGVLVAGHGPFTWGKEPWESVHHSVVLEEIAQMAYGSLILNPEISPISDYLLNKHFMRKHGPTAYFDHDDMGR